MCLWDSSAPLDSVCFRWSSHRPDNSNYIKEENTKSWNSIIQSIVHMLGLNSIQTGLQIKHYHKIFIKSHQQCSSQFRTALVVFSQLLHNFLIATWTKLLELPCPAPSIEIPHGIGTCKMRRSIRTSLKQEVHHHLISPANSQMGQSSSRVSETLTMEEYIDKTWLVEFFAVYYWVDNGLIMKRKWTLEWLGDTITI